MPSFDDPVGGVDETTNEGLTLGDVLTSDAADPSEAAVRKRDWEAFLAALDTRSLAILRCLAEEVPLQLVADAHLGMPLMTSAFSGCFASSMGNSLFAASA